MIDLVYIPELNLSVAPPLARLYQQSAAIRKRWATNPPPGIKGKAGEQVIPPQAEPPQSRYKRRCLHLLARTEHRQGCSGWMCKHQCALQLPAVPGAYCQTCDKYEDDGPFQ